MFSVKQKSKNLPLKGIVVAEGLKEGETDIYRANLMRKIGRGRELKRNKNTQVFFFLSPNRKPNEDFKS
jgi:hypothetical protein